MQSEKPWHEQDEIWAIIEPALFSSINMGHAVEHVDNIIKLIELKTDMHVLDLCCGVGRHTLELARRGYRVTAVDRNEAYLQKAMDKAKKENLDVEFVREDMRRFCRPGRYDVVLNINTSFGYFENPEEDKTVIGNIYKSLNAGGVLFFDMNGKENIARIFQKRDWQEFDDLIMLQERYVEDDWNRIAMRWIIIKDKKIKEVRLKVRIYSASEIRELLLEGGFRQVDIFGSFEGIPYDHKAKRLVVVARK